MITLAASLSSASYVTFAWADGGWSAICFVLFVAMVFIRRWTPVRL